MADNFIWNISKDKIYLVDDPTSYKPLKEDYIIGQYDDQGVTLQQDSMTAPTNVNYFVSLWNASYPDKAISKKQLFVKNANNQLDETQDLLNLLGPEIKQQAMLTQDIAEFKSIVSKGIIQHNARVDSEFKSLNVSKISPQQWRKIPEEEVGHLLTEDAESYVFSLLPEDERIDFVQENMEHWEQWGYPNPPEHIYDTLTVDPNAVDWNSLFEMIPSYQRTAKLKWKKK